jgi:hypothetical protein
MKELIALLLLLVLFAMGWSQPYKAQFRYFSAVLSGKSPASPPVKAPSTPPRDTSWLLNR